MPIIKIAEPDKQDICTSSEHNPPAHMVYSPGTWEHTCPQCGKKVTFTVSARKKHMKYLGKEKE